MKILSFGVLISAMLKFNRNIQNIGFMPYKLKTVDKYKKLI